jgi:hypothetical protein
MRVGVGVHEANRYNISIPQHDLACFNYQKLIIDKVEKIVNSNDSVLSRDVVLQLAVIL